MAEQIPKFKSKRQVLQMKHRCLFLQTLMIGLCVFSGNIYSVQTATCPSSVPISAAITTEQSSFSGYTNTYIYGITGGPVSNSLYYLYALYTPSDGAAVKKVDASGSQSWMVSFALDPIQKSLSVDVTEQSVYFARFKSDLVVLKLAATDGSIVTQHQYTGIKGDNNDIKTWPLTDLSGYFVIGYDSSTNIAKICKYTFSLSSAQCQTISNINKGYGHLMISNNQFFILDVDSALSSNLQMYKITFSSTLVDWANQILCTLGGCATDQSESLLSSDGSTIFSFFIFGSSNTYSYYLYFCSLSVFDGSVKNTRYRSDTDILYVLGSSLSEDYIVATTYVFSVSLVIYSISSSTFTIKSFSGDFLYGCVVEPSSGRFIVGGRMGNNGYTAKFVTQSISLNSDFSPDTWSMTALPAGTDDIIAQSRVAITAPTASFTPPNETYTNQTFTYIEGPSINSDAYMQIAKQSFSISESTTSFQTPDLPCSFSGSTSIVYSLSSYNSAIVPSFVTLNSTTGALAISASSISSSTVYNFYIDSMVSGISEPVQKIINLTVNKCTVSNCQTCSLTNSNVCTSCNLGYSLNSGSCILNVSDVPNAEVGQLSVQIITGTTLFLLLASSLLNSSSIASLWSMIHQTQIFFLLLFTGAFIPNEIESVVTGLKICLNPFAYLQSSSGGNSNFVSDFFDFGLVNNKLEKLGIKSDSTAVNIYSFILSMIIISALHLCIALFQRFLIKKSKCDCCQYILIIVHWILNKLMILFTFAIYIRILLKTNQYILFSCVSEIYHFNVSGAKRIISLVISFISLIACITMIIIILFAIFQNKVSEEESPEKRSKFAHLFNGVSPNKKSRLYIAILQIRRAVFVILLITVGPVSSTLIISILVGLQVIYLSILIIIRPFELVKCNIIEVLNEMYFFTMLASLLKFNSIEGWEGTPTTIYAWFISSNSIFGFTIILKVQPIVASRVSYAGEEIEPSNVRFKNRSPMEIDQMARESRIDNRR